MKTISVLRILLLFLLVGMLNACSTLQVQEVMTLTPTLMPTVTATITPTIIWFPPTPTRTSLPTAIITPTEDLRPIFGEELFADDFSEKEGWTVTQNDQGSIAYGPSELTIAIGETNAYLLSVRESPILADFYLEITAAPSLCRGEDEYGVLFRVNSTSHYYRYTLSCDGQLRLDVVNGDEIYSPQPWMYSGAVPPGAPSYSRLGIFASGKDMSFYINGQYLFSITEELLTSGGLGVFARSVNKEAVTINFSDLKVYGIP